MLMFALVLVLILLALRPDPAGADPVFPPDLDDSDVERLRRNLEPVISLPERELLRLIPDRAGIYFVDCPNCDGGAQEGQIDWTIEDPDRVFCKYCGLKYPNAKFPDTEILSVVNPVGQTQAYPYWEDDSGYRHFFQAKGWYRARAWFANAAYDLATLYFATGRPFLRPACGPHSEPLRRGLSGILRPPRPALPAEDHLPGQPGLSLSGPGLSRLQVGLVGLHGHTGESDLRLRPDPGQR